MSTISDKLIQIKNIKQDIKEAINTAGGSVNDDFSTYPGELSRLLSYENPDFYDLRTTGGTDCGYLFAYVPNTVNLDFIANWDTSRVTNMKGMFTYCKTPALNLSSFDTSKVTDMSYMFRDCGSSISGIENWDLSSLTDASYMFYYFTNNNTYLDLSVLDFSNVSNVSYMFQYSNTDYLDVRNINLAGATDYSYLFGNCSGTELDLSSWDVSNVTNLQNMFYFSNHKKIDLAGWNTNKVTNMGSFLNYARSLTTLLIPDWDMTNTTSTGSMFNNTSALKYIDASRCNDTTMTKLASSIPTRTLAAYGEIIARPDLSQDAINALAAKYWKPIGPKIDLVSTELVFELDEIKPGKTTKVWTGNNNPWYGDDRLETIEFISSDESVATVNGREITSTGIEGTTEITAVRREDDAVLGSTTLSVSETDNYPNLITFRTNGSEGTSNILVVNGTNLSKSKLNYIAGNVYSYDPGKQITSIKFYYSSGTSYINEIIKFNFNAANITDAYGMLAYYKGTTLDLSDWDTSRLVNATVMFERCPNLQTIKGEIDLSNMKVVGSTNQAANGIVSECPNLETLYLKNIYKNSNMTNHFYWSIDLGDTKVKDECLLYIINELPDLINDKGLTNTDQIILTLPKTNTLTEEQVQPAIDKGWTVANVNY